MRNYKRERQLYYGYGPASSVTPEQRANRRDMRSRQQARDKLKKTTTVRKHQDVHHIDGNPRNNKLSNLQATSRAYNRSKNKHKNKH